MSSGLFSIVIWLCCLLSCLVFGLAIIIGIVLLIKRSTGSNEEASVETSDDVDSGDGDVSPEEETQQIPDDVLEPSAPEAVEPAEGNDAPDSASDEPVESDEPAKDAAPANPKAAGQTIIAFDDDDEDF